MSNNMEIFIAGFGVFVMGTHALVEVAMHWNKAQKKETLRPIALVIFSVFLWWLSRRVIIHSTVQFEFLVGLAQFGFMAALFSALVAVTQTDKLNRKYGRKHQLTGEHSK